MTVLATERLRLEPIEQETGELIGAGCIQHLGHDPANEHEIGWRLRPDRWGRGYATEAARRMAAFAFDDLGAPSLAAICHPDNVDSAKLMRRLGMHYRGEEVWHAQTVSAYAMTALAFRATAQRSVA